MADKTLRVILTAEVGALRAGLAQGSAAVKGFSNDVEQVAAKGGAGAQKLGKAFLLAGGVIAAGFAASIVAAANFETQMRNVTTISDYTAQNFGKVSQQILAMSNTLPQSASELAQGLYDVASSGFAGADGMVVLKAAAVAASAGLTTTATSGKAITAVLNAYGLGAGEARKISDQMFQTVNLGVVSFEELSGSVGDVVGVASAAGVSFKEVGGAIATITLAGISGSEATTSLNRTIQSIIQPSDALKEKLKQMGFESGEAALKSLGLKGVMDALAKSTDGSATSWLNLFPEIRAARGALALTAAEGRNYQRVTEGMNDATKGQGATRRALAEQSKALGFQLSVVKNQIVNVGITIGTALLPVLKVGAEIMSTFVDAWNDLPGPMQTAVQIFAGLAAVLLLAGGAMLTFGNHVLTAKAKLEALGPAGARATAMMGALVKMAAGVVGVMLLTSAFGDLSDSTKPVEGGLLKAAAGGAALGYSLGGVQGAAIGAGLGLAGGFVTRLLAAGETVEQTRQRLQGLSSELLKLDRGEATGKFLKDFANNLLDGKVKSFTDEVKQLGVVSPVAARKVVDGFVQMNAQAGKPLSTKEIDKLNRAVEAGIEIYKSRVVAGKAGADEDKKIAEQALKAAGLFDTEAASAEKAADALKAYKQAMDSITNIHLNAEQAAIQFEESLAKINETLTKNGADLQLNTAAGRENRSALLAGVSAANDHAAAIREETGSSYEATLALGAHVTGLLDTANAAGISTDAAIQYVAGLYGIPPDVATNIHSNGDLATIIMQKFLDKVEEADGWDAKPKVSVQTEDSHRKVKTLAEAINSVRDKYVTITVEERRIRYDLAASAAQNSNPEGYLPYGGVAHGALMRFYGDGDHVAQIAPANMIRVWAEPETGGEAYIPLAKQKRKRSSKILQQTAKLFGLALIPDDALSMRFARGGIAHYAAGGFDPSGSLYDVIADAERRNAVTGGIRGTKSGQNTVNLETFLGSDPEQIERSLRDLADAYVDVEQKAGTSAADQLASSGLVGRAYSDAARKIISDAEDQRRAQEDAAQEAERASKDATQEAERASKERADAAKQAADESARAAKEAADEAARAAKEAQDAWQQTFDSFADPVRNLGDIVSAFGRDVDASFGSIQDFYGQAIRGNTEYAAGLAQLKASGLNATTFSQILEQGPESLNLMRGILEGGADAVRFVNESQATIEQIARGVGTAYAGSGPGRAGAVVTPPAAAPVGSIVTPPGQQIAHITGGQNTGGNVNVEVGPITFPHSSSAPPITEDDVKKWIAGQFGEVAKRVRSTRVGTR